MYGWLAKNQVHRFNLTKSLILRVENVQFLKEETELLFKLLQERLFFLFRQFPELLFERTEGFLASFVDELFFGPSCLPFILTVLFHPLVHGLSKRGLHQVIDPVLKTRDRKSVV